MARSSRLLLGLLAVALLPGLRAAKAEDRPNALEPFLKTHCLRCHGDKVQEGEFRLDTLSRDLNVLASAQRWSEVMTRVNAGEMPPKKEPQPTPDEIGGFSDWIIERIRAGEATRMQQRASVSHFRLSREEYGFTVYDMLGVQFDPTLPGTLNEDPRWNGFERVGAKLTLSPSHIERYFKAAELVLERAFPPDQPKPVKIRADAIELRHRDDRKRLEALGIADKVRVCVWPGHREVPALRGYWGGGPRPAGRYRARVQLSGLQPKNGRPPHLTIWHQQSKRSVFDQDIVAAENKPVIVEFETYLSGPADFDLLNEVSPVLADGHTRNVLVGGGNVFLGTRDLHLTNPTGYQLLDDEGQPLFPLLLVDWIEWEGPLVSETEQQRRDGLLPTANSADVGESRDCLQRLAERAWRRPVTDAEVERYVGIVQNELAAGEPLRGAPLGDGRHSDFEEFLLPGGRLADRATRAAQRLGAGCEIVVFSLELDAGRRAVYSGAGRHAASAGGPQAAARSNAGRLQDPPIHAIVSTAVAANCTKSACFRLTRGSIPSTTSGWKRA